MRLNQNQLDVARVALSPLVRDLLPPDFRHRVHPLCRMPKGHRLMWPGEKVVSGCKYTQAKSPKWIESWASGKETYDPFQYFIHCIPIAERMCDAKPTPENETNSKT